MAGAIVASHAYLSAAFHPLVARLAPPARPAAVGRPRVRAAPVAQFEPPNVLQLEAIRSMQRATLVLASAGTGKTRVLRARIAYLLLSERVPSKRILTVAFSQHAVEQLRTRVSALTGSTKGMWLGTIHSICARMVREHHERLSLPRNFEVLAENDLTQMVAMLIRRHQSALGVQSSGGGASAVLQQILLWKERGVRPADVRASETSANSALAAAIYPEYQMALKRRNALDHPDLTLCALRLFQQHPTVLRAYREQFDHILCDELQDTSAVQYEWLRVLASAPTAATTARMPRLFCAADDDQAIYGWRGAERTNVLRLQQDFPSLEVIRFARSYRCSPHVLGAAQALLSRADPLVSKTCFSQKSAAHSPRVLLRGFWDSQEELKWISAQITERHGAGERWAQMAVLVRSAEQARSIAAHLRAAGFPVTSQAGNSRPWTEAAEVQASVASLRLVRSTADDDAAAQLLCRWGGLSELDVQRLARQARVEQHSLVHEAHVALHEGRLEPHVAPKVKLLLGHFASWQDAARRARSGATSGGADAAGAAQSVLVAVLNGVHGAYAPRSDEDGAHRKQLLELASRCESLQQLLTHFRKRGSAPAPHPLRSAADAAAGASGAAAAAAAEVAAGAEEMLQDGCVSVMTVHRSKGLEWDTVFLPGWEEGTFPVRQKRGEEEEEWRLAYVALTRCRALAAITFANRRMTAGRWVTQSPSSFLEVLPSNHLVSFAPNRAQPYYRGVSGFRATNGGFFRRRGKAGGAPQTAGPAVAGGAARMDDPSGLRERLSAFVSKPEQLQAQRPPQRPMPQPQQRPAPQQWRRWPTPPPPLPPPLSPSPPPPPPPRQPLWVVEQLPTGEATARRVAPADPDPTTAFALSALDALTKRATDAAALEAVPLHAAEKAAATRAASEAAALRAAKMVFEYEWRSDNHDAAGDSGDELEFVWKGALAYQEDDEELEFVWRGEHLGGPPSSDRFSP